MTPVAGEELTYQITFVNNGPSDIPNLRFRDIHNNSGLNYLLDSAGCGLGSWWITVPPAPPAPALANTCNLGPLAAGDSLSFEIVVEVDPVIAAGTPINNNAQFMSYLGGVFTPLDNDDIWVVVETVADLAITKVGVPDGDVQAGDLLTYTIRVENLGPSYANPVIEMVDSIISDGDCAR